jgi:hypothetical protein
MSEWNSLENDLRKWAPRRPSPELRSRIFGSAPAVAATPPIRLADLSRWLVPAFGCFLLMIATLSNHYRVHDVFPLTMTNLLLSENSTAYNDVVVASHSDHSDVNSLPARRLEWSFGTRSSVTSFGSVLASYTNKLIQ